MMMHSLCSRSLVTVLVMNYVSDVCMKYLYFYFHHDNELALLLCENFYVFIFMRETFGSCFLGRFPAVVFGGAIIL